MLGALDEVNGVGMELFPFLLKLTCRQRCESAGIVA